MRSVRFVMSLPFIDCRIALQEFPRTAHFTRFKAQPLILRSDFYEINTRYILYGTALKSWYK
ncbi:hypothetical protein THMIRHAM_02210 [Thiomicrorhabdus immobilis]|uniref:Uncharacterized protein n=1 Tax=Thiomicrorhabdus immobilis TaxID=2791037 RepID=A0ABM7MAS2_9GAMM|nr:hypothetical protein THMIRHAM_02210 [Thiomicrorhabdus immobilis]